MLPQGVSLLVKFQGDPLSWLPHQREIPQSSKAASEPSQQVSPRGWGPPPPAGAASHPSRLPSLSLELAWSVTVWPLVWRRPSGGPGLGPLTPTATCPRRLSHPGPGAPPHAAPTHLLLREVLIGAQEVGGDEALPGPHLCHEAIETQVEHQAPPGFELRVPSKLRGLLLLRHLAGGRHACCPGRPQPCRRGGCS